MSNEQDKKQQAHLKKMEALKENIDASIAAATIDRGVGILLTGNGKGKSSSAFGMVMRALGYEYKVGVVQFIKGQQLSGEEIYVREQCPSVTFHQMNTGFTWDTQDRSSDIVAAKTSWAIAEKMLKDDSYHLVVLDELTYMISFDYLDEASETEEDMLDKAWGLESNSRLSCQTTPTDGEFTVELPKYTINQVSEDH